MTNTNIVLGTEVKVTFNNDGYVLTGKVVDFTENMRYILIENEVDTFNIDTQKATVEVLETTPAPAVQAAEINLTNKEVKAKVQKLTKWYEADSNKLYIEVYEEEGAVDVLVNYYEDGDLVEDICVATFYDHKEAMKFARKLHTAIKRYAPIDAEIVA
ncbi:hypothetical protein [Bacillus toyonensis]|uniref:hypothetical protein n=1 Tax=Bacillus toyonensis TaxID=155322 RepID=UPI000BF1011C|nr:hypothetical protein [Bacillus toyonensis]PEL24300.1 hypothetical protein CN624_18045 [Bacillus toyonensis]